MGGAMGNALSVARSLGRQGVDVHLLEDTPGMHSRYARSISPTDGEPPQEAWLTYLLGPRSEPLRGAVLLACGDIGIELLIEHGRELSEKFVLDVSEPQAQRRLLSKLSTYEAARDAGVPAPRFWQARTAEEVESRRDEYVYPLILKPLYSHLFQAAFRDKFFRATDYEGLLAAFRRCEAAGVEVILLEEIPGPDDRLCSYYTYIDENDEALCDFTKRVLRRFPENRGLACYHVTDWNPEARELGLRLFRHVGLRGVGNVEFKRDHRDGLLKVIECNARFTAGNALLVAAGYDLALFVYNRLTGTPGPQLKGRKYELGRHYWFPEADLRSFLELRAQGRMTGAQWLRSVAHRQVVPFFTWDDPVPSAVSAARFARRAAAQAQRRLAERARRPR
jgi:predicted ATP-grasp superfamily ATP-dependent carboligase